MRKLIVVLSSFEIRCLLTMGVDEDADPLYDPFLDDEDERWVDERRRQNIQAHLHGGQQNRSLISKTRQTGW